MSNPPHGPLRRAHDVGTASSDAIPSTPGEHVKASSQSEPSLRDARGDESVILRYRVAWECALLRETCGADNVTVRLDAPEFGLDVDVPAGEATSDGTASLESVRRTDQRSLATVRWLERHRRTLAQPDFHHPPSPSTELAEIDGIRAQMLGPIIVRGDLVGWVSVHSTYERPWARWECMELERVANEIAHLFE